MIAVQFKMEGFRELDEALKLFPIALQRRVLNNAIRRGAVVIRAAIRANAPMRARHLAPKRERAGKKTKERKPGFLRRAIKLKNPVLMPDGSVRAQVGTGAAFYAIFLEKGTRKMPAKPFFRLAVDSSAQAAVSAIRDALVEGIGREIGRMRIFRKTSL